MVPAYALIVGIKAVCAVNLFLDKHRCACAATVALCRLRSTNSHTGLASQPPLASALTAALAQNPKIYVSY